ncbi:MAG: zinc metallopeptidase [Pseudomonadota bacterium]
MSTLAVIAIVALLALVFGPSFWVKQAMQKHGTNRPDFPGTGGELADHLVAHYGIDGVNIEETKPGQGDHYDPETRTVRLSPDNFHGTSLTAVAVATHEVGHAIQHYRQERGLATRQALVRVAMVTDRIASVFFIAAPFLFVIARTPAAIFGMVALGIALLGIRVLVHLVTLPVEYDASFNKALPILREGGYLTDEEDLKGARTVLRAAALTYVAGALMSLLDLARWIRILR